MNTVNLDILLFSHSVFSYYVVGEYAISDERRLELKTLQECGPPGAVLVNSALRHPKQTIDAMIVRKTIWPNSKSTIDLHCIKDIH